jgi:PadR family transcriptional regulator, regulatory protein AphA
MLWYAKVRAREVLDMAIRFAILGLLSWHPFSGYEMKKVFAESTALYWTGNSNQIYPALIELHREGFVTSEAQQQGSYPAKKVYSITARGLEHLREWLRSPPELPQLRCSFLTQLAWADLLSEGELSSLLGSYEEEVRLRLLMQKEKARRQGGLPRRTEREAALWDAIAEHDAVFWESELQWVRGLLDEVAGPSPEVLAQP